MQKILKMNFLANFEISRQVFEFILFSQLINLIKTVVNIWLKLGSLKCICCGQNAMSYVMRYMLQPVNLMFLSIFSTLFLGVGFLSTNSTYSDPATLHAKISRLDREITVRFAANAEIHLFNILPLLFLNLFF